MDDHPKFAALMSAAVQSKLDDSGGTATMNGDAQCLSAWASCGNPADPSLLESHWHARIRAADSHTFADVFFLIASDG